MKIFTLRKLQLLIHPGGESLVISALKIFIYDIVLISLSRANNAQATHRWILCNLNAYSICIYSYILYIKCETLK